MHDAILLECGDIYQCERSDQAECMRMSILSYMMEFYIYEDQTVVMEDGRTETKEPRR